MNSTINKETASDVVCEVLKVEGDILRHADFQQTTWCYMPENRSTERKLKESASVQQNKRLHSMNHHGEIQWIKR
jgi:hypothetical protein